MHLPLFVAGHGWRDQRFVLHSIQRGAPMPHYSAKPTPAWTSGAMFCRRRRHHFCGLVLGVPSSLGAGPSYDEGASLSRAALKTALWSHKTGDYLEPRGSFHVGYEIQHE
jgi:hypothetical protein